MPVVKYLTALCHTRGTSVLGALRCIGLGLYLPNYGVCLLKHWRKLDSWPIVPRIKPALYLDCPFSGPGGITLIGDFIHGLREEAQRQTYTTKTNIMNGGGSLQIWHRDKGKQGGNLGHLQYLYNNPRAGYTFALSLWLQEYSFQIGRCALESLWYSQSHPFLPKGKGCFFTVELLYVCVLLPWTRYKCVFSLPK